MGFYDSVKDDIREENGEEPDDTEEENMAFDQLKKDAETGGEDEESSSDTEIEVLGDGTVPEKSRERAEEREQAQADTGGSEEAGDETPSLDGDAAEVLRRIEEQNKEMLSVLRGIKRSLE